MNINFKYLALVLAIVVNILESSNVLADNNRCQSIHDTAKIYTINGQSDIPNNPFVIANKKRVQFYSAPNDSCKLNNVFVIFGDFLYAYKKHNDYIYVSYSIVKGDIIFGWVNHLDLKKFTPENMVAYKKYLAITDFIAVGEKNGLD